MTAPKKATAYIDGSGNSGRIQACAVSLSLDGSCDVYEETQILPPHTTNNVGEYSGLLLALNLGVKLGVGVLQIRSDSQLIVNQMAGRWRCKDENLRKLQNAARKIEDKFQWLEFVWIPRELNKRADALCRAAIKEYELKNNQSVPPIQKHSRPRPPFLISRSSPFPPSPLPSS